MGRDLGKAAEAPASIGQAWQEAVLLRRLKGAIGWGGRALGRRFVVRVGCQAATNQGREWRQVGVAPRAQPRPPELPLQVEWASGEAARD